MAAIISSKVPRIMVTADDPPRILQTRLVARLLDLARFNVECRGASRNSHMFQLGSFTLVLSLTLSHVEVWRGDEQHLFDGVWTGSRHSKDLLNTMLVEEIWLTAQDRRATLMVRLGRGSEFATGGFGTP